MRRTPFGRRLVVPLGLALAATACTIDAQSYIQREEKRFPAATVVDLHLYTFDGAVEVRTWDQPEVLITVEKRGEDQAAVEQIEVIAERTGNRIQVEARHPDSGRSVIHIGSFTSPSARFIARVPGRTNLVVRSGDGAVRVERVEGTLELRTDDGAIHVVETRGRLLAESRDGQLQLDDVAGVIEARTDDGSVHLSGTPSVLRARTGDGAVVLRIRDGARMTDDWMVATDDGSISIELPTGFDAEIEADPGDDGRARSDLTLADVVGGTRDRRSLRGRLGEGGHRLVLRTGDGSITITDY